MGIMLIHGMTVPHLCHMYHTKRILHHCIIPSSITLQQCRQEAACQHMAYELAGAVYLVTPFLQHLLQGRPVQSVQWGAWAEAGMAAGQSGLLARLTRQGYGALLPAAGLAVLRSALQGVQGVAAEAVRGFGSVLMAAVFHWHRFLSGECRGDQHELLQDMKSPAC